jgi:hypothetical protein
MKILIYSDINPKKSPVLANLKPPLKRVVSIRPRLKN